MRLVLIRVTIFSILFIHSIFLQAEPSNLSKLINEIHQYHDSGQYEHEINTVTQHASEYILERVKRNQKLTHPKKLAVVLDIDETCLSNYNGMAQYDFTANKKIIHHRILVANSPAITPMLNLYRQALHQGVSLFFVTGRSLSECEATQKNLLRSGYTHWKGLYCRSAEDHTHSVIPFKTSTRQAITQQGYTIVATIGDQLSDIQGGYAEKGFKLPNPYYYLP